MRLKSINVVRALLKDKNKSTAQSMKIRYPSKIRKNCKPNLMIWRINWPKVIVENRFKGCYRN